MVMSRIGIVLSALGFGAGLLSAMAGPPVAAQALDPLEPGVWRTELGGFSWLERGVAFGRDDVWAVGDGVVRYLEGGWRQILDTDNVILHAIDGLNPSTLWVGGEYERGPCVRYGVIYRYDGRSWQAQTVETDAPIYDIAMLSETDGWAVGGLQHAALLRYDGTSWRDAGAPEVPGLRSIILRAADDIWVAGHYGALVHFDGFVWTAVELPDSMSILDMSFTQDGLGLAVGVDHETNLGFALHFDGNAWRINMLAECQPLSGVAYLAPELALAVGVHGVIMRYDGQDWRETGRTNPSGWPVQAGDLDSKMDSDAPSMVNGAGRIPGPDYDEWSLRSMLHDLIVLPGTEELLAVGAAAQIAVIDEDGRWSLEHSGNEILRMDLLDSREGWILQQGTAPIRLHEGRFEGPKAPRQARFLIDVETLSPEEAWAVGRYGTVMHFVDERWQLLDQFTWLHLKEVGFSSPSNGWMIASDLEEASGDHHWRTAVSIVFHWDGSTWSQVLRLCASSLSGLLPLADDDLWIGDSRSQSVLHYDGASWTWHPIHGAPEPEDNAATVYRLELDAQQRPVGYGNGVAALERGVWRTRLNWYGDQSASWLRRYAYFLGSMRGDFWGGRWLLGSGSNAESLPYERVGTRAILWTDLEGELRTALLPRLSMNTLETTVSSEHGSPEVWAGGHAGTLLRYRPIAPDRPLPLASPSPALPAPAFHPSATPAPLLSEAEAAERILAFIMEEFGEEAEILDLALVSALEFEQQRYADDLGYAFREWSWTIFSPRGTWIRCQSGGGHPVWVGTFDGLEACSGTLSIAIDGMGRSDRVMVCYLPQRARIYLPMLLQRLPEPPTPEGPTRTPTPPPFRRNLTPSAADNVPGNCPTPTPYPTWPGGGYPAPAPNAAPYLPLSTSAWQESP